MANRSDKERDEEKDVVAVDSQGQRLVMRQDYCCDCDNCPDESLALAATREGSPCKGCWFDGEKPNWKPKDGKQYYTKDGTLMNSDGSRSIFDDVDA